HRCVEQRREHRDFIELLIARGQYRHRYALDWRLGEREWDNRAEDVARELGWIAASQRFEAQNAIEAQHGAVRLNVSRQPAREGVAKIDGLVVRKTLYGNAPAVQCPDQGRR